jgi:hypothetical protein
MFLGPDFASLSPGRVIVLSGSRSQSPSVAADDNIRGFSMLGFLRGSPRNCQCSRQQANVPRISRPGRAQALTTRGVPDSERTPLESIRKPCHATSTKQCFLGVIHVNTFVKILEFVLEIGGEVSEIDDFFVTCPTGCHSAAQN